jgi:hypothetical protein
MDTACPAQSRRTARTFRKDFVYESIQLLEALLPTVDSFVASCVP